VKIRDELFVRIKGLAYALDLCLEEARDVNDEFFSSAMVISGILTSDIEAIEQERK